MLHVFLALDDNTYTGFYQKNKIFFFFLYLYGAREVIACDF